MEKAVFFVLGVLVAHSAAQTACTASNINTCLGDMVKVATKAQAGGIPSYTPDEFKTVCKHYKAAASGCLGAIRNNCPRADQIVLDSVKIMFDYLCGEGLPAFVNNSECFLNPELAKHTGVCTSNYQSDVNRVKNMYGSTGAKMEKLCGYSRDMVDCTEGKILKYCNGSKQASSVIRKSSKLVIEFSFRETGHSCHINAAVAAKTCFLSLILTAILIIKNYL